MEPETCRQCNRHLKDVRITKWGSKGAFCSALCADEYMIKAIRANIEVNTQTA